jgi:DNA methylase
MRSNGKRAHFPVEHCLEWRHWVTPKLLKTQPVHRWFSFPHSFTGELVDSLIDEWGLDKQDRILDPFVGAGTTLVAAKERGIPAVGYDLSPLAVFCSNVKVSNVDAGRLEKAWNYLERRLLRAKWPKATGKYPQLVRDALPGDLLGAFEFAANEISNMSCRPYEREVLRLALVASISKFSRAEATGGWLKWVSKRTPASRLPKVLGNRVRAIVADIRSGSTRGPSHWRAVRADARCLRVKVPQFSAVVTSPPYPNRHDYTRVFGVELMFAFCNWNQTRRLRYQTFHSHPEAKPVRRRAPGYMAPSDLVRALRQMRRRDADRRILAMVEGYFLDMYLCFREIRRVTKKHSPIAVVLGNAQFNGVPIPVDQLSAEVGELAGLRCAEIRVVRVRGNSAQQMAEYGRRPSRESVVIFERV